MVVSGGGRRCSPSSDKPSCKPFDALSIELSIELSIVEEVGPTPLASLASTPPRSPVVVHLKLCPTCPFCPFCPAGPFSVSPPDPPRSPPIPSSKLPSSRTRSSRSTAAALAATAAAAVSRAASGADADHGHARTSCARPEATRRDVTCASKPRPCSARWRIWEVIGVRCLPRRLYQPRRGHF